VEIEPIALSATDQLFADAVNARNDAVRAARGGSSPAWRAIRTKAMNLTRDYAKAAGLSLQDAARAVQAASENSLHSR
jgi:hypothetical protein